MKNPGCGGCPPHCNQCVFSPTGEKPQGDETLVQTAHQYGCRQGFGDIVKDNKGRIGQKRGKKIHFLSESGLCFLNETKNPLLAV